MNKSQQLGRHLFTELKQYLGLLEKHLFRTFKDENKVICDIDDCGMFFRKIHFGLDSLKMGQTRPLFAYFVLST